MATTMTTAAPEQFAFQSDVSKVLDIVINSIYTDRDVAIREVLSNASDALNKKRLTMLQSGKVVPEDSMTIHIIADKVARTLTIRDNGIGMSRQELIDNLGTIAHSGTADFVKIGRAHV